MNYSHKVSIKLTKKLKELVNTESKISIEFIKSEIRIEKNIKTVKSEINNRVNKADAKILKFINEELPKWFYDHDVLYETDIQCYLINVLERVYKENPSIL